MWQLGQSSIAVAIGKARILLDSGHPEAARQIALSYRHAPYEKSLHAKCQCSLSESKHPGVPYVCSCSLCGQRLSSSL